MAEKSHAEFGLGFGHGQLDLYEYVRELGFVNRMVTLQKMVALCGGLLDAVQ